MRPASCAVVLLLAAGCGGTNVDSGASSRERPFQLFVCTSEVGSIQCPAGTLAAVSLNTDECDLSGGTARLNGQALERIREGGHRSDPLCISRILAGQSCEGDLLNGNSWCAMYRWKLPETQSNGPVTFELGNDRLVSAEVPQLYIRREPTLETPGDAVVHEGDAVVILTHLTEHDQCGETSVEFETDDGLNGEVQSVTAGDGALRFTFHSPLWRGESKPGALIVRQDCRTSFDRCDGANLCVAQVRSFSQPSRIAVTWMPR